MTIVDLGGIKLQIYKSVPWAKGTKVLTFRKPPSWALTKIPGSSEQEIQWMHQAIAAHQGKWMSGRIWYVSKKGHKMRISSVAAFVGLLRRRQVGIEATLDAELKQRAAEILYEHGLDVANKRKYASVDAALAVVDKIPQVPVLTTEAKEARKEQKRMSRDTYTNYIRRFAALTKLMTVEEAPAYPSRGPRGAGKGVFDDFF